MFRIKVCGLTSPENAKQVVDRGVDAIGLNFYSGSRRFVQRRDAVSIADQVRGRAAIVGLFVNSAAEEIEQIHQQVGFDWIQLHGDQSYDFARQLHAATQLPIMVACRGSLSRWKLPSNSEWRPEATLIDAAVAGQFGGTGQMANWDLAASWQAQPSIDHLVLAGGLNPENVAAAIKVVSPSAVDVAGGVEIAGQPGIKDLAKVARFVEAAVAAFDG